MSEESISSIKSFFEKPRENLNGQRETESGLTNNHDLREDVSLYFDLTYNLTNLRDGNIQVLRRARW